MTLCKPSRKKAHLAAAVRDSAALYILRRIPLQRALCHGLDHRHLLVLDDLVRARDSSGLGLGGLLLLLGDVGRGLLAIATLAVVVGLALARERKVEVRHVVLDDDAVLVDEFAHAPPAGVLALVAHGLRGGLLLVWLLLDYAHLH